MAIIGAERTVDAPAETAWDVIARPEAIDQYADNVSRAETQARASR